MKNIRKKIGGMLNAAFFYDVCLDTVLRMFDASKRVPRSALFSSVDSQPEGWCSALAFLVEEGYLKETCDYYEITYKGEALVHNGGFRRKHLIERALFYSSVVAAVCSVLSLAVSVVALCR
jgi:hypothetical protein